MLKNNASNTLTGTRRQISLSCFMILIHFSEEACVAKKNKDNVGTEV